jgi:hypothetical protein
MPKPPTRNNLPKVPRPSESSSRLKKPIGISDLLGRSGVLQQAIARQTDRGVFWREFFTARLPSELAGQVTHVVERDGALSIYAASAAWSARLRFAVAEHWPAAQEAAPGLKRWSVRVQPAAASTGARA